ncbi:MAG: hypothetical protein J0I09_06920 [Sphingobacteriia bacterium]|nr:hypothetical protein [Sphingobacteriia bacterium]
MNRSRDLLMLTKNADYNELEVELELQRLNQILFELENISNFCLAHEIIDINKGKIITKKQKIEKKITAEKQKPFVFIFNKN